MEVTGEIKNIFCIAHVVAHDCEKDKVTGVFTEDTLDWYAQDIAKVRRLKIIDITNSNH
jgi:hypothetical protein